MTMRPVRRQEHCRWTRARSGGTQDAADPPEEGGALAIQRQAGQHDQLEGTADIRRPAHQQQEDHDQPSKQQIYFEQSERLLTHAYEDVAAAGQALFQHPEDLEAREIGTAVAQEGLRLELLLTDLVEVGVRQHLRAEEALDAQHPGEREQGEKNFVGIHRFTDLGHRTSPAWGWGRKRSQGNSCVR